MSNIQEYLNSGILELYVLGITSNDETIEVTQLAEKHVEIRNEIDAIIEALKLYSQESAPEISPATKALLFATIDYKERLRNGEKYIMAPLLNKYSKIEDFKTWIERTDMQPSDEYESLDAKIISASPEVTTLVVWLKYGAPSEIHDNEFEHFLIVEGTCTITIGNEKHNLIPGDYLSIPLFIDHDVEVTSTVACKVILQRVAA